MGREAPARRKQGGGSIRNNLKQLALLASLAVLTTAIPACASLHLSNSAPSTTTPAANMPVLATTAVPGLSSTTIVLTPSDLAKDAPIAGLDSKIAAWGYLDGRQRTFQGPSRHLTLVISRSLAFRDEAGANAFVSSVVAGSAPYFGVGVQQRRLFAQGRSGWLFTPPPCACHLANPSFVGVLVQGSEVIWLQINGPDATPALLVRLLDPSRSVPAI